MLYVIKDKDVHIKRIRQPYTQLGTVDLAAVLRLCSLTLATAFEET